MDGQACTLRGYWPPPLTGGPEWMLRCRYCHVYRKGELSALVAAVPGMRVITSYYDTSNWCVVAERVADAENVTPRPRTTRV